MKPTRRSPGGATNNWVPGRGSAARLSRSPRFSVVHGSLEAISRAHHPRSDLRAGRMEIGCSIVPGLAPSGRNPPILEQNVGRRWRVSPASVACPGVGCRRKRRTVLHRSEEHTSELQSPCNLVCRLLLEKKKKVKII